MQPNRLTTQQTVILYCALGILMTTYAASLIVGVVYLIMYPDRMMPVFVLGFIQAVLTTAGLIIGVVMGVHMPAVAQSLQQSVQDGTKS